MKSRTLRDVLFSVSQLDRTGDGGSKRLTSERT